MSRTFYPLSIVLISAALAACGGSSSETPPPLEPDPAMLGKRPPPAPSSGAAPSRGEGDALEPSGESSNPGKAAPPTIGEPATPY